ncbi:MAG: hypothetical protein J5935_00650 [Lachnospiraceae bacterium]|nr:hypothetical protein [Lachnospiraceae bacterium]
MKKTMILMIAAMAFLLTAGCGAATAENTAGSTEQASEESTGEAAGLDLSAIKTVGDALSIADKDEYTEQQSFTEENFVYAFQKDGVTYRVVADLTKDLSDQLFALEFDDDYDKNVAQLIGDVPVKTVENLDETILSQEELDQLIGKTGQELFDAGWRSGMFYNYETLEVWLEYGAFAYDIHFDGEVPKERWEEFDVYVDLADKKVKDIRFEGLGDATYLE